MTETTTGPGVSAALATPVDPTAHLRDYHYPRVYADLLRNTAKHEMTVLKDDGLYSHLRFREPGTGMYGFDVITWPGYLTIVGDIADGYTFTRETDMFGFFDHGQPLGEINASYWAEKLAGRGRMDVKSHSAEKFKKAVIEHVADAFYARDDEDAAEVAPLKAAALALAESELFEHADSPHEAREALEEFRFVGVDGREESFSDVWEWDFTDYDYHFVIACHAVLTAARAYRTLTDSKAKAELGTEPANV